MAPFILLTLYFLSKANKILVSNYIYVCVSHHINPKDTEKSL